MEHFLGCHIHAFEALGIPETILYDNLKTGILGRRDDGSPIFPGRFLDFALYYGYAPHFCQPKRARTKDLSDSAKAFKREAYRRRKLFKEGLKDRVLSPEIARGS